MQVYGNAHARIASQQRPQSRRCLRQIAAVARCHLPTQVEAPADAPSTSARASQSWRVGAASALSALAVLGGAAVAPGGVFAATPGLDSSTYFVSGAGLVAVVGYARTLCRGVALPGCCRSHTAVGQPLEQRPLSLSRSAPRVHGLELYLAKSTAAIDACRRTL